MNRIPFYSSVAGGMDCRLESGLLPASTTAGWTYGAAAGAVPVVVWLLALARAAVSLEKSKWQLGTANLAGVLLCLGGLGLLYSVWRNRHLSQVIWGRRVRYLFAALLAWCVVIVVRVDWRDFWWQVRPAWAGQYFAWAWVVPASMVLGADMRIWRQAFKASVAVSGLGCFVLVCGWVMISLRGDFSFTQVSPVLLLFYHYFTIRWRRIILLGTLISLLLSILAATRNEVLSTGLLMLGAGYIQFQRHQLWRTRTRVCIFGLFALALGAVLYVASVDHVPLVGDTINSGIDRFKDKLMKNTRSTVEGESLYSEFFSDVQGLDLVIGRGCMGIYRTNLGSLDSGVYEMGRRHIECGYLQVILHGGLVALVLILTLAVPAIYLGLFRSRNWFAQGCALLVITRLCEMVPFGLPSADVRYMLFWMAIGACLAYDIRMLSEDQCAVALGNWRAPVYRWCQ